MKTNNLPNAPTQLSLLDKARQQADAKPDLWKPAKPGDGIEGTVRKIVRGGKYDSFFLSHRDGGRGACDRCVPNYSARRAPSRARVASWRPRRSAVSRRRRLQVREQI